MEQCPTTTRKPARLSLGKRLLLIVMLLFAGGLAFDAVPLQSAQASEAQHSTALPAPGGGRGGGHGRVGNAGRTGRVGRVGRTGRTSRIGRTGRVGRVGRTGRTSRIGRDRHRRPGFRDRGRYRSYVRGGQHRRWRHRRWYNNRWYYDYDGSGYYTCACDAAPAVAVAEEVEEEG